MNIEEQNDAKYLLAQNERLQTHVELLKEELKKLKSQKTVEHREGLFRQTITRHDGKKRVRTQRLKKNPEKVTLARIGMIEIFAYPYSSFDKVFFRIGKEVLGIDKYDAPKVMRAYRRIKWYVENGQDAVSGKIDSECAILEEVVNAYNAGVKGIMEKFKKGERSG